MQHPQRAQPRRPASTRPWHKLLLPALVPIAVVATMVFQHQRALRQEPAPAVQAAASAPQPAHAPPPVRLAEFGDEQPSRDARLVANWVVATGDHQGHAFILVDKKDAHAYVFTPEGRLQDSAPVLLGAAVGDAILPGSGEKPPAQLRAEEKTTPAGRFVAEPGTNADNEDVIWVDYDNAISMHRVRPWVAGERRLERLASPGIEDNRVSFGCINLPVTFYEEVAKPAATREGAIVYVLPEVNTPQQVFGAWDVTDAQQFAAARQRTLAAAGAARAQG